MVDRIRWDTVSYLPFYYVFFQFLLLTIFNLQANILTTKDILSNLGGSGLVGGVMAKIVPSIATLVGVRHLRAILEGQSMRKWRAQR